jgi:4-alpha-glucanotransferase
LGPQGQNWGLPPIDPRRLAADGYRFWSELVRAACRHAGALRIDHVMGLFRQFWIPEGMSGRDGAYVRFPAEPLIGILALESVRAGAIVVGEDLGTVPPVVPPLLERWGILSSKVLYFERDGDRFRPPRAYPRLALATVNTHDLATLAAFWEGDDITLRRELGLIGDDAHAEHERHRRQVDRGALLALLATEGLIADLTAEVSDAQLRAAVHALIRRTPSWLVGLSLDDVAGEREPVNVPGVHPDEYPTWSRRMRASLETIRTLPGIERLLGVERVVG